MNARIFYLYFIQLLAEGLKEQPVSQTISIIFKGTKHHLPELMLAYKQLPTHPIQLPCKLSKQLSSAVNLKALNQAIVIYALINEIERSQTDILYPIKDSLSLTENQSFTCFKVKPTSLLDKIKAKISLSHFYIAYRYNTKIYHFKLLGKGNEIQQSILLEKLKDLFKAQQFITSYAGLTIGIFNRITKLNLGLTKGLFNLSLKYISRMSLKDCLKNYLIINKKTTPDEVDHWLFELIQSEATLSPLLSLICLNTLRQVVNWVKANKNKKIYELPHELANLLAKHNYPQVVIHVLESLGELLKSPLKWEKDKMASLSARKEKMGDKIKVIKQKWEVFEKHIVQLIGQNFTWIYHILSYLCSDYLNTIEYMTFMRVLRQLQNNTISILDAIRKEAPWVGIAFDAFANTIYNSVLSPDYKNTKQRTTAVLINNLMLLKTLPKASHGVSLNNIEGGVNSDTQKICIRYQPQTVSGEPLPKLENIINSHIESDLKSDLKSDLEIKQTKATILPMSNPCYSAKHEEIKGSTQLTIKKTGLNLNLLKTDLRSGLAITFRAFKATIDSCLDYLHKCIESTQKKKNDPVLNALDSLILWCLSEKTIDSLRDQVKQSSWALKDRLYFLLFQKPVVYLLTGIQRNRKKSVSWGIGVILKDLNHYSSKINSFLPKTIKDPIISLLQALKKFFIAIDQPNVDLTNISEGIIKKCKNAKDLLILSISNFLNTCVGKYSAILLLLLKPNDRLKLLPQEQDYLSLLQTLIQLKPEDRTAQIKQLIETLMTLLKNFIQSTIDAKQKSRNSKKSNENDVDTVKLPSRPKAAGSTTADLPLAQPLSSVSKADKPKPRKSMIPIVSIAMIMTVQWCLLAIIHTPLMIGILIGLTGLELLIPYVIYKFSTDLNTFFFLLFLSIKQGLNPVKASQILTGQAPLSLAQPHKTITAPNLVYSDCLNVLRG